MIRLDYYDSHVIYLTKFWFREQIEFNEFFQDDVLIRPLVYLYGERNGYDFSKLEKEKTVYILLPYTLDIYQRIFNNNPKQFAMLFDSVIHDKMWEKSYLDYGSDMSVFILRRMLLDFSIVQVYSINTDSGERETLIDLVDLDHDFFNKIFFKEKEKEIDTFKDF